MRSILIIFVLLFGCTTQTEIINVENIITNKVVENIKEHPTSTVSVGNLKITRTVHEYNNYKFRVNGKWINVSKEIYDKYEIGDYYH